MGRRRGFSSERNRRYLRQGEHAYIIGEKLRSDSPEIEAALSRQGRYTEIGENLRVKEVKISESERFVICHNPEAAGATSDPAAVARPARRAHRRVGPPAGDEARQAARSDSTKPGLNRYLRVTGGGLLRIDKAKIKTEANLDGKFLLRCSDPHLPATDIARGYKQLLEVERGWRDMKQSSSYARSITASKNASVPTSCCAGWRCCSSASSRPAPAIPGTTSAVTSTASTPAPSPGRPGCSASAPSCPSPNATCSPSSTSPRPRR